MRMSPSPRFGGGKVLTLARMRIESNQIKDPGSATNCQLAYPDRLARLPAYPGRVTIGLPTYSGRVTVTK